MIEFKKSIDLKKKYMHPEDQMATVIFASVALVLSIMAIAISIVAICQH